MSNRIKQSKIEIENALEAAAALFETCTTCGLCKGLCPVYRLLLDERISPRGHAITLSKKLLEKAVYQCTLCKACEQECPLNIKICEAIRKAREAYVLQGKEPLGYKKLLENVKKYGLPGGKDVEEFLKE